MSHTKSEPKRRESSAAFDYEQFSGTMNNQANGAEKNNNGNTYLSLNDPNKQRRASVRRASRIEYTNPSLDPTLNNPNIPSFAPVMMPATIETPIPQPWSIPLLKKRVKRVMDSFLFQFFATIFTLWALFSENIRLAITLKSADIYFEVIISLIFFFFLLEIAIKLFCEEKYFHIPKKKPDLQESFYDRWYRRMRVGSFYFFIDFVSTWSLVIEMPWMVGDSVINNTSSNGRTVSVSSVGTRITRIIRLIRIVRLVRLIKVATSLIDDVDWANFTWRSLFRRTKSKKNQKEAASRVGAAMTELTNRRVTLFVLIMYVIIPLLSVNKNNYTNSVATQFIHRMAILNQSDPATYSDALSLSIANAIQKTSLIGIQINDQWKFTDQTYLHILRPEEIFKYELTDTSATGLISKTLVIFNVRGERRAESRFAIWTTLFIMLLLSLGIYFFSREVNRLVIIPIEKMVALVKKISANPLGVEYKVLGEKDGFVEGMETTILLTTITKIGGLMRVGFGEAGASIIARTLADSAGGKLNLMGAGTMIHSIFGFCDVRQFTDTTECLQEEVMLFVNRIAHILHGIVVQCAGAANKNIGDAFLLTWKIDEKLPSSDVYLLADQALLSFCRSLISLSRYHNFICNFSVGATSRLFTKFPGYKVRIGCGLHVGWAVEGAIGSNRKIDASYLSPHVSFTEFLESSTKKYGVSMLLSEQFYRLLSPEASSCCRQVDYIKPTEDENPLGLYTYDVDLRIDWEEFDRVKKTRSKATTDSPGAMNRRASMRARPAPRLSVKEIKRQRQMDDTTMSSKGTKDRSKSKIYELKQLKNVSQERGGQPMDDDVENAGNQNDASKEAPKIVLVPYDKSLWATDEELLLIRKCLDDKLRKVYDKAFRFYQAGDWPEAKSLFEQVLEFTKGKDGPSLHLLSIINDEKYHGVAPHDWRGYTVEDDDH